MGDIVLKVLGTAQDGGYPQPGCDCPNCQKALNNNASKRFPASLGVLDIENKKSYIIDTTPYLPEQLNILNKTAQKHDFPKDHLEGVLITHAHMGHYPGLMYFGKEAINSKKLSVHTSKSLKKFLITNQPWKQLVDNGNIQINIFDFEKTISLSTDLKVIPIEIPHRQEFSDTSAFVIKGRHKSAFYLPDIDSWVEFNNKFNEISEKTDFLILDGTFYSKEELMKFRGRKVEDVPHPTIKDTFRKFENGFLKRNNSKVYFTHFNHTNPVLRTAFKNKIAKKEVNFLDEGKLFNL